MNNLKAIGRSAITFSPATPRCAGAPYRRHRRVQRASRLVVCGGAKSMLTLEWLKSLGGIEGIEKINEEKAQLLYNEIDSNPLFQGVANKEDRSTMNVTFTLVDESKKEKFDEMWKAQGISGINGHRSVGGYRASIYNAMPIESIQTLVNVMKAL